MVIRQPYELPIDPHWPEPGWKRPPHPTGYQSNLFCARPLHPDFSPTRQRHQFTINDANNNLINTNSLLMETFDTNYNPILTNTIATYITNQQVFASLDFTGTNILTTYTGNQLIQVTLNFYQWEYPIAVVSLTNRSSDINAYNYYRLQTRIYQRNRND